MDRATNPTKFYYNSGDKTKERYEKWTVIQWFGLLSFVIVIAAAAVVPCSLFKKLLSVVQFVWSMHKSILYHMVLLSNVLKNGKNVGHEKISVVLELFFCLYFTYNLVFGLHCWLTVDSRHNSNRLCPSWNHLWFTRCLMFMFIHMWRPLFHCSFILSIPLSVFSAPLHWYRWVYHPFACIRNSKLL